MKPWVAGILLMPLKPPEHLSYHHSPQTPPLSHLIALFVVLIPASTFNFSDASLFVHLHPSPSSIFSRLEHHTGLLAGFLYLHLTNPCHTISFCLVLFFIHKMIFSRQKSSCIPAMLKITQLFFFQDPCRQKISSFNWRIRPFRSASCLLFSFNCHHSLPILQGQLYWLFFYIP